MDDKRLLSRTRELLATPTPALGDDRLREFVSTFVARREDFLGLARTHGSPLYVLEPGTLRRRYRRLRDAFAARFDAVSIHYAVKSNNLPAVSRILVEEGAGLDVSSGLELAMAAAAGATSILFSGPGKTDAELAAALDLGDRTTVLIDSFGELARLDRLTRERGATARAGVRLTTQPRGLWRKFGVPLAALEDFLARAEAAPGIDLRGLQFHTSWNMGPEAQVAFLAELGATLRTLPARRLAALEFLDVGGGYWPEQGEWLRAAGTPEGALLGLLDPGAAGRGRYALPAAPIEAYAESLADALAAAPAPLPGLRLCLEPGRWLCHGAMHLLMTVVDVKGGDLAITDAGTNAVGWERFEHDYFPVINLSRPALDERPCLVLGSLCTPHDVWGDGCHGASLEPGDVLLIPDQGAYTYSLRQDFIKPLPGVASLEEPPASP